ncbi:MAG: beta-lactamase family protein [Gaiellaceae bacterium MAG52_C11]|nr:beta-lactamase family protein [Candidatus Gaiellasilicea maunaloa]
MTDAQAVPDVPVEPKNGLSQSPPGREAPAQLNGFVAPGLEAVLDEFERNFTERGDIGAAFAVYRDEELVIDLWAGQANRLERLAWTEDTLSLIFSGTKPLVATCLLLLIDRGQLQLERPVADYWPEFAAAGKEQILVSHLVTHRAGLPGFQERLEINDLVDDERLARLLAAQEPLLLPGGEICYHGLTFGWLCGELVRRIDGRSVGRFFAEDVASPLGLEAWIGLPPELERRVATLELSQAWGVGAALSAAGADMSSLAAQVWANPPTFDRSDFPWNSRAYHAAEIPGANGIATARSVARLFACLARGGEVGGVRLLSEETVHLGTTALARGYERVLAEPMAVGVGVQLQTELMLLGPAIDAFGHAGAGGSIHGAWPSRRIGFSYVVNLMLDGAPPDPRPQALLSALHRSL